MPSIDPTFFVTRADFRTWLEAHGEAASELLVGFYRVGSGLPSMTWPESVDEALCYGWIDGVRRRLDERAYTIRFTPRKPGSTWSEVNVRRAGELISQGRMRPRGLAVFEARDESKTALYSYEARSRPLEPALESRFRQHAQAWAFFEAQPPSYRKVASWYVMSARREDTRARRLDALIAVCLEGRRLPQVLSPAPQDRRP